MTMTYKSMLRWKNCRIMILLLAEELSAVPTMVASLSKREANRAAGAAVHHLVLHPVVCCRTAGLVADRPAKHSATAVTYQDFTVVPGERKAQKGGKKEKNKTISYLIFKKICLDWIIYFQNKTFFRCAKGIRAFTKRNSFPVCRFGSTRLSYLEMAREVISAGWALSLRSKAVCMVSLLRKTSWRSHL